jgi:pilus assembly protein CpaB
MANSITSKTPPAWLGSRSVLIAALVLGAITAGLIVAFLATRDDGGTVTPIASEQIEVVVAKQDIAAGTEITASMLEVRELPEDAIIAGAATEIRDVAGEIARYPLVQGEQINVARLTEAPSTRTLSSTIPDGMRGFTIPVDVSRSPSALMVPGDFVDVIATFGLIEELPDGTLKTIEVEGGDQLLSAVTIYQNIQVLAVQHNFVEGRTYDEATRGEEVEDNRVSYITLALTPEQSQQLWLLTQDDATDIGLTLRGFGDGGVEEIVPTDEPYEFLPAGTPTELTQ